MKPPGASSGPIGAVHVEDRRTPDKRKELLADGPPGDPKTGLTPAETMIALEDAARAEKTRQEPATGIPGVFNHPPTRAGAHDKCGAKYGRCFGDVINGVCKECGYDYRRASAPGGVSGVLNGELVWPAQPPVQRFPSVK